MTEAIAETETDWPAHRTEHRPWRQQVPRGPRADRSVRGIDVRLPPLIRDVDYVPTRALRTAVASAVDGLVRIDQMHGDTLGALNQLLLRTESVASSKIENIEASLSDYGRALMGKRANASAVSMAAATDALSGIIVGAGETGRLRRTALLEAHHALFRQHPDLHAIAGQVRTKQNWIGGSDYSPRNALFVPPPPETVLDYLDDLFAFANRDDLPPLVQAAIVHAQFESIHPFIDGNGRIGRTLIHAVLRRRGITKHLTVPIASGFTAHRERYFEALGDYREGRASTIIGLLTSAAMYATHESRRTVTNLHLIGHDWQEAAGEPARGTATAWVLRALLADPIVTAPMLATELDFELEEIERVLERLHEVDVVSPLSPRRRDRVWGAHAVLDEVRDLGARIESMSRRDGGETAPVWMRPFSLR